MSSDLGVSSASRTHRGNIREINEDSCLELPGRRLWVVADGMGGHEGGEIASGMIVDALRAVAAPDRPSARVDQLEDVLVDVNTRLRGQVQAAGDGRVIGSTVVALLAFARHCVIAWAGDSRAYRLRQGVLRQLTRDHSTVEELVAAGSLTREQATGHAESNVITRAVGGADDLFLDMELEELLPGDRYLLCSDGLYRELSEGEIAGLLMASDPDAAGDGLIAAALAREGSDNVTVVVVDFLDSLVDNTPTVTRHDS